jgi:predicted anti-sigma-YlaC factor YlaD
VTCGEVRAVINCYVDCECDVTTMLVIARHLDVCRDCVEELSQLRWLKSAVRRCGGAPESPPCP